MDERRTADSSVILSEYFETMRQFLETRNGSCRHFLGSGAPQPARTGACR